MAVIKTPTSSGGMALDIRGFSPAEIIPTALINTCTSKAGVVEGDAVAVQVPYLDFDADAGFVAEGAEIPESDPDQTGISIITGKVAVLARVSREQYEQGDAATLLSDSMKRSLLRKSNWALLAQPAPTPPALQPPAGLLNLGVTAGGAVGTDLDALADALATIEGADGEATHIICSPSSWATLSKLKSGTGSNASLVGAGTEAAARQLLSVPVTITSAMTANSLVVLDKTAVLSAFGDVKLTVSDLVYFSSDSVGIRATFRFGAALVDGARVIALTTAA